MLDIYLGLVKIRRVVRGLERNVKLAVEDARTDFPRVEFTGRVVAMWVYGFEDVLG